MKATTYDLALAILEIFDMGTPAEKARATRAINAAIAVNGGNGRTGKVSGTRIQDWSAEERDPDLYAELMSDEQMAAVIAAAAAK